MVAALDAQTNHSYGELMAMQYKRLLILNLDVREHLNRREEQMEQARGDASV